MKFSSSFSMYGNKGKLVPFLLSSLGLTTIFTIFLFYSPNPFTQRFFLFRTQKEEQCDLFKGHWIEEVRGSQYYTNSSCVTIPNSKNCFRHGRKDGDFLNWRWKPDECELPRFDTKGFLEVVGGKTLAFIGDSVARNHMESLLCLLSQEEVPVDVYKDSEDRNRIWYFPNHDFTLKILWTKFLVVGEERLINGSSSGIFDLHLDKVDENWSRELHTLDYIIISDGHWFFRQIYLHQGSNVVACVYCNDPNVTDQGVNFAVRMAFRTAFNTIDRCKKCRRTVTLLRTFSPSHFENGFWNTGGSCNKTSPDTNGEVDPGTNEWKVRSAEIEEVERARKRGKQGKRYGVLDVTRAMLLRPDGHPGAFWGNKWMKGYNDCVHWCLPGPIDVWNDFLQALLKRIA